MKKTLIFLLIVSLLLLPACGSGEADGISDTSSAESGGEGGETSSPAESPGEERPEPEESQGSAGTAFGDSESLNSAFSLFDEITRLDGENVLFSMTEYGTEMKWMEANQITNLERGTPVTTEEIYFLLIPKYAGSKVEVQHIEFDGDQIKVIETYYSNASVPDNFGLIITSREPETMPELRVVVEYQGRSYEHDFYYDGRGDREAVRVFSA